MIVATDVQYNEENRTARAAAVAFTHWFDSEPFREWTVDIEGIEPYVPGEFYKRELPCLMKLLQASPCEVDFYNVECVVVDGHVWLGEDHPGLGKHLYDALIAHELYEEDGTERWPPDEEHPIWPIIGVAKTRFHTGYADEVFRSGSMQPLYVTTEGISPDFACSMVQAMHGQHRIPTLLKRVDALARGR